MAITEARAADPSSPNPQRLVAKGWVQGVALVMLFGFFVMGVLAFRTYTDSMPAAETDPDKQRPGSAD